MSRAEGRERSSDRSPRLGSAADAAQVDGTRRRSCVITTDLIGVLAQMCPHVERVLWQVHDAI